MEALTLKGGRRAKLGTRHARRLRASGRLPAIIYGHGESPEPIDLPSHDVEVELLHGARVLEVDLDNQPTQYLIKAVQYDYLGTTPVHLDLMRVSLDEEVTVGVGIELRGTPKGISDGGVLDRLLAQIEVRCVVSCIPETLHPNVTHLGVGDSLLIRDLELPDGVTPVADGEEMARRGDRSKEIPQGWWFHQAGAERERRKRR